MAQYYNAVVQNDSGLKVYDRKLAMAGDPGSTLQLQARWFNQYVNSIAETLQTPSLVWWIGDQCYDHEHFDTAWKTGPRETAYPTRFTMHKKYLIDYTDGVFIDCNKYYENSLYCGFCYHPLPLLTAVGNEYTEEYIGTNADLVGSWAGYLIGISDKKPSGFSELEIDFKEDESCFPDPEDYDDFDYEEPIRVISLL